MTPKKVSIITLGCPKNQSDTANLKRVLEARGHTVTDDTAQADAIVIHTCSFIEAAKRESIQTIVDAGRHKKSGRQLLVTGCMVQQHGEELLKELPEVDAFLGTGQLGRVADLLDKPRTRFLDRANPGGFMDPDSVQGPRSKVQGLSDRATLDIGPATLDWRSIPATAYLRLSEGCSHPCSFCVIPRLRGPVQSRSAEHILREARSLAEQGVEELIVIGQDTGDWGREQQGKKREEGKLPQLLRQIGAIPGIRWVRLMYMHPASFTQDLLDVFAENPDRFPYLDMPLQHIDSAVLSDMRRMGDEAGLRALLDRIHRQAPKLTMRTTFIVGFPGETDAQFERLLHFVKEGHFHTLGAFAYSQEEGTAAGQRRDQIPDDVKKGRLEALTSAYYDVAHRHAQKRLGQSETVLIEETEGDDMLARSSREAPEIDAVIRLPARAWRRGRFVQAKLTGYDAYEFTADPV